MTEFEAHNTTPAVETVDLVRLFGDFTAVDHLNLRVDGEVFRFSWSQRRGQIHHHKNADRLAGPYQRKDSRSGPRPGIGNARSKRRIGVVPEDLNLFERLTGAEMLAFTGRMYGLQKSEIAERAPELLGLMELESEPKKLIVEYSHGMKRSSHSRVL